MSIYDRMEPDQQVLHDNHSQSRAGALLAAIALGALAIVLPYGALSFITLGICTVLLLFAILDSGQLGIIFGLGATLASFLLYFAPASPAEGLLGFAAIGCFALGATAATFSGSGRNAGLGSSILSITGYILGLVLFVAYIKNPVLTAPDVNQIIADNWAVVGSLLFLIIMLIGVAFMFGARGKTGL